MSRAIISEIADWTRRMSRWRELVPYEVHRINASDTHLQCEIEVRGGHKSRSEVTFEFLCARADHNGYFAAAQYHQQRARRLAQRSLPYGARDSVDNERIVDHATSLEAIAEIIRRFDPERTSEFQRHLAARVGNRTRSELQKDYRRRRISERFLGRRLPARPGQDHRLDGPDAEVHAGPIDRADPERIVNARLELEAICRQLGNDDFNWLLDYLERLNDQAKSEVDRKRMQRIRAKVRETDGALRPGVPDRHRPDDRRYPDA